MKNTKLKQYIVEKLNNQSMTLQLAERLDIRQRSVQIHLDENKPYGRLTWMDALEAISDLTGLKIMDIIISDIPISEEV